MVISIRDLVPSYMLRASGNDWADLYEKLKKIREETPSDEELVLDFNSISVSYNTDTLFATDVVALPNTRLIFYNNKDIVETFKVVALMSGKSEDSVENRFKESGLSTTVPLTKNQKRINEEEDLIKKYIDDIFVMNGTFYIGLSGMKKKVPSIESLCSTSRVKSLCKAIMDSTTERLDRGEMINKIVFNPEDFYIGTICYDLVSDLTPELKKMNIELQVRVLNDTGLAEKMRLKTEIENIDMSDDEKRELFTRMGKGYVGILTKFKSKRTKNIERRLDNNELDRQFVAVIRGIGKKGIRFDCYPTNEFTSRWDEFMTCGEDLGSDLEYESKNILYDDMGVERACLGALWHFNTFDGKADGVELMKTFTTATGTCGEKEEIVSFAEFTKRVLLSRNIEFNVDALTRSVGKFESEWKSKANQ